MSNHERDARCHSSIDAFVAQRMTAGEFHCGFRDSTGGEIADPGLVGLLRTVRNLCDAYASGLSPGAGYRVSDEQFRSEVCHVVSLRAVPGQTSPEQAPARRSWHRPAHTAPIPRRQVEAIQSPAHVFDTRVEAEEAIQLLGRSGFDVRKLSLIGKGYHAEEYPIGFYTVGDKIEAWGGTGAFWGGVWGLLLAPAVFFLPGVGLVAMAGPFVAALVGALEGALAVGGLSAVGAALSQLGVPKDHAIEYEAALKVDKYVLLVHGGPADQARADAVLANAATV